MFSQNSGKTMVFLVVLGSAILVGQYATAAPSSSVALEFPVTMRQSVIAGTTPVGTKVQAKLAVATLVDGVVIPEGAILSGEVIESIAKSGTNPSRLAIRMDSVQWKNKSVSLKVYLTAWYYPVAPVSQYRPDDVLTGSRSARHSSGIAVYPTANPSSSPHFPNHDPDSGKDNGAESGTSISEHRTLMNNVESTHDRDGAVAITSKRVNIKLDKRTTYVLASSELAGGRS
jgi:hypothetical protein